MYHETERRLLKRYKVPEAEVSYKASYGAINLVSLVDISKSGVRFEMDNTIENGDFIEIEIAIPTKEKIAIKGHVIWTSETTAKTPGYAVVQFLPVGKDDRFNSEESISQIDDLINAFQDGVGN